MKIIALLLGMSLSLVACKGTEGKVKKEENASVTSFKAAGCPDEGNCSVAIKEGDFTMAKDGTGAMYPVINEGKGERVVCTFDIPAREGLADSGYTETVMFNVPMGLSGMMVLEHKEMSKVNLTLNKQCFCRGQAGYHPINKGKLIIKRNKAGDLTFNLQYELDGIDVLSKSINTL
jgi:hypothetical protein